MSCTPSLWRRSPLADTPSLLASGGDILKCWDVLEDYRTLYARHVAVRYVIVILLRKMRFMDSEF